MNLADLQPLRDYFRSGATRSHAFRKEQLKRLKQAVLKHEEELYDALYTDLRKSREESWVTEVGFLVSEINATIKNLQTSTQKLDENMEALQHNFLLRGFFRKKAKKEQEEVH